MPQKERVILFVFQVHNSMRKDYVTVWSRVLLEKLIYPKLVRRRSG